MPKEYYRNITNLHYDSIASVRKSIAEVNNENSCFVNKKRKCDDSIMGCEGADTMTSNASCPSVDVEPIYKSKKWNLFIEFCCLLPMRKS